MTELLGFLRAGLPGDLVPWKRQSEAAARFGLSLGEVEEAILAGGFLPARYQRNRRMLSTEQQLRLFRSTAAVIGCGGLGGYVLEELARLGVGRIVAVDPDTFEEHNLNRQILSSPGRLGFPKARAAAERLAEINPAVTVRALEASFSPENAGELLEGAAVAVDALDSAPTRLRLAEACGELGIPLVHGAIAGWYGHVTTVFPGDDTLRKIYGGWREGKGIERELGNPSFTPAVVASLEAAEACKVLLGEAGVLRHRILTLDLREMKIGEFSF